MTKRMLVDATHPEETRVAIVDERRLEDFDFESTAKKQLKGNIYLAKVIRIEPSLQAAFVEYGGNRHGFLPFSEIHPDYFRIPIADRPHDAPEDDDMDDGDDAEVDAETISAYQNEAAHDHDHEHHAEEHTHHEHPLVESAESAEENPAPALAAQEAPYATAPYDAAPLLATSETLTAQPIAGLGVDAANELGLITDFGNAVGDNSFVPSPVEATIETVGGEVAEVEAAEQRVRRPRMRQYKIQEVVKRRQVMLIQVVKEERGNKGAALTTYLSLAGRYCVLMPNTDRGGGVSRKITSHQDRKRMKDMLDQLETPEGMAVILRTAGMEQEPAEIQRDLEHLLRLWNNIREQTLASSAPTLIYEEANLIKRCIRDLYAADVSEILVAGQKGYDLAHDFMKSIMPEDEGKVRLYEDSVPLFFRYNVEKQIDFLYNPVVQLRSGGYIVINPTEALVSIDVNSGRSTRERHIEGTALKTNLEAADEVARQLRLRDLAGLVVIDFIDMEDGRNNAAVERRMKEAMKVDRARLQIGRISPFGLMELSRQRLHSSLTEINFERCAHCSGVGLVRSVDSAAISILRMIEEDGIRQPGGEMVLHVPTKVALYILNQKRSALHAIEHRYNLQVLLHSDDTLVPPDCKMERSKGGEARTRVALVDSDNLMDTAPLADDSERTMSEPAEAARSREGNREGGNREGNREGGDRNNRRRGRFGRGGRDGGGRDGGRDRNERPDRNDRNRNDRPAYNNDAPQNAEANGNVVPSDEVVDDNIGNNAGVETHGEGNAHPSGEGRQEGRGRRRGRRGGRGRRNGQGGREGQPEGGTQPENGNAEPREHAPREHSQRDHTPRERPQREHAPRERQPYQQSASVPTSIHELDTTPREHRGPAQDFAPRPSPYEVTNPDGDDKNPKGGWWRKLTGQ